MKHFLLEGEHLVSFSELSDLVPLHHAFLQKGYDDGVFLFSGPQIPAHGGFLVARAASREALQCHFRRRAVRQGEEDAVQPNHRVRRGAVSTQPEGLVCAELKLSAKIRRAMSAPDHYSYVTFDPVQEIAAFGARS
jgi:uncharacterized protein YciI